MVQLMDVRPRETCDWAVCNVPSPRTALKRLAAKSATLVPNFILEDDNQIDQSVEVGLLK